MNISIHVPREGHDIGAQFALLAEEIFLSTCPGRGTTAAEFAGVAGCEIFLSTCPGRGTTGRGLGRAGGRRDFYPRAPGGARPVNLQQRIQQLKNFYPRAPGGARHGGAGQGDSEADISIHVPREGHDLIGPVCFLVV